SPLAEQGGPRALDAAPLLLSARGRCAADGALDLPGPHAARPRTAARGIPRPPPPRVVPAHVAEESDLRRGGTRLSLVAGHRRALVGAAEAEPPHDGTPQAPDRAAVQAARQAPQHPRLAAELHPHAVPEGLAAVPEGQPPRPESRPEPRGAPSLR